MRRPILKTTVAALALLAGAFAAVPAQAHGWGGWHGGGYGGWHGPHYAVPYAVPHHDVGAGIAAGIFGLAAGAIASATAPHYVAPPPVAYVPPPVVAPPVPVPVAPPPYAYAAPPAYVAAPNLTQWVQHALNVIMHANMAEDGIPGPETANFVSHFQRLLDCLRLESQMPRQSVQSKRRSTRPQQYRRHLLTESAHE